MTDMRKVRPRYGNGSENGPWVIAEAVHDRDTARMMAEPWPFAWTCPGVGGPPEWMTEPKDWFDFVRWAGWR